MAVILLGGEAVSRNLPGFLFGYIVVELPKEITNALFNTAFLHTAKPDPKILFLSELLV